MRVTNFHKVIIVFLCLVLAGPEFSTGLELIVLMDTFGLELLLFSLSAYFWVYWGFLKSKLEELDPYFFISPAKDILRCPALLAHAVSGLYGPIHVYIGFYNNFDLKINRMLTWLRHEANQSKRKRA